MKLKNSSCILLCGTFERVKARTTVYHPRTLGSLTYVYKVVYHMGTIMEIPLYFIMESWLPAHLIQMLA